MSVEIIDCIQGSPEWFAARAGIPTASNFATVRAKGTDGGASKTRAKYMRQLAGEIITGKTSESYSNDHMSRGQAMEAEARDLYSFRTDEETTLVGFVKNGPKGASPDALIGKSGALEIKTALPDILIEQLLRDSPPPEHKAQTQGALWVCEREWLDLVTYWPGMPLLINRVYRDEPYIAELAEEVDRFNAALADLVERIRGLGSVSARDNRP